MHDVVGFLLFILALMSFRLGNEIRTVLELFVDLYDTDRIAFSVSGTCGDAIYCGLQRFRLFEHGYFRICCEKAVPFVFITS